jgi:hypothetical protein
MQKTVRDSGNFINRQLKYGFVRLGWIGEATDLAHELQGRRPHLFGRDGWIEVEQCSDVSTHGTSLR